MAENEKKVVEAEAKDTKPAKAKKEKKKGRVKNAWKGFKSELKKIVWPSWKQVLKNTGIVILCVLVIGVFIWVFDALAHLIIDALLGLFS